MSLETIPAAKERHKPRADLPRGVTSDFLSENPAHLIRRLQQVAVALFLQEMAAFHVTPVQYCALISIAQNPGTDQLRLSQRIGYDKSTVAGVVERLAAKGLIRRAMSTKDRRARTLSITARGARVLRDSAPGTERLTQRIFEALSPDERPQFHDMLLRIVRKNNSVSRVPVDKLLRGKG